MGTRLLLLLVAFGLAVAGALYGTAVARRQRREIAELRRVLASAGQRVAVAAHQRDVTAATLAQARQELAELPQPPAADSPAAIRNADIKAWLGRVHRLHALFAAHPEATIPEMMWLTDADWLRVAKDASLDGDSGLRRAMAGIRAAAVSHFGTMVTDALQRAATAHAKVSTPADLAPYFEQWVPAAVLNRYELKSPAAALPGLVNFGPDAGPLFREKLWVDEIYDPRHSFSAQGAVVQDAGPLGWEDGLWTRVRDAYKAYSAANRGTIGQPALRDVFPYAQPPLDAATQARLLAAERAAPIR